MARILLIDDNPLTLADMAAALESVGHKALLGGLGRRALHDAATLDYDCLVTDTVLKGASGWYLMRCARRANPTAAIIATDSAAPRGNGADLDWIAAFNAMNGADATIAKPLALDDFKALVARLLADRVGFRPSATAAQDLPLAR